MLDFDRLNLLTVSPKRLGDTLFCTPIFRYLKTNFKHLKLTVVTTSALAHEILSQSPDIDALIKGSVFATDHGIYDLALNVHRSTEADDLFQALNLPILDITPSNPKIHRVENSLSLLEQLTQIPWKPMLLDYSLPVLPESTQTLTQKLNTLGLRETAPLLGFHLGCHGLSKKKWFWQQNKGHSRVWPVNKFIALAKRLQTDFPELKILITGAKQEFNLAQHFSKFVTTHSLVGKLTLFELRALMEKLTLYICSNTGPVHVACSSNVNLVALYDETFATVNGLFPRKPQQQMLVGKNVHQISLDEAYGRAKSFFLEEKNRD